MAAGLPAKNSIFVGKIVLLTFGLLSPNKGFENVIRALPRILSRHSNVVYIIAGATHPHVRRREGDRYRLQLQALAKEQGVEENVVFHNRFVSPEEMASLVGSADIYVTPYPNEAGRIRNTRLCLGCWEGDHFDSVLACRRTLRRWARGSSPVQ
jgi:glycosyltransferase involved in cell wall biosynthesis